MNVKTLNVFSVEAQYISWLLLTMLSLKVVEIVDRAARRGGWQIGVGVHNHRQQKTGPDYRQKTINQTT